MDLCAHLVPLSVPDPRYSNDFCLVVVMTMMAKQNLFGLLVSLISKTRMALVVVVK